MPFFMVRDADNDEVDDARRIEAYDARAAAEDIASRWFSERELYDRRIDEVRIGVRPLSDGEGVASFDIENPDHPETVLVVTWRLEPTFTAEHERFWHPLRPARCFHCNRRVDAHPEGTAYGRCPFVVVDVEADAAP